MKNAKIILFSIILILLFSTWFITRYHVFNEIDSEMQATDSYADYGYMLKGMGKACGSDSCKPDYALYYGHFGYILTGTLVNFFVDDPVFSLRLISLFSDLGVLILVFIIAKKLFDENTALLSVLIYIFSAGNLIYSTLALTRSFFTLFCLLILYLLLEKKIFHAIPVVFFASTIRLDAVVFIPIILGLKLLEGKDIKKKIIYHILVLSLMIPVIVWFFHWHMMWPLNDALNVDRLYHNFIVLFEEILTSYISILFLAGLFLKLKDESDVPLKLFLIYGVVFSSAFLLYPQFSTGTRHYLHLVPIIMIYAGFALIRITNEIKKESNSIVSTLILVMALTLIVNQQFLLVKEDFNFYRFNRFGMKVVVSQFENVDEGSSIGICKGYSRAAKYFIRYFFDEGKYFSINCSSTVIDKPDYILLGKTHRMQTKTSLDEQEELFSNILTEYALVSEKAYLDSNRVTYHTRLYEKKQM